MKKLFLLGACLLALGSTPVLAQIGGTDVVVVRVYGGTGTLYGGTGSRIVIAREGGKTEELEFNGNNTSKAITESAKQVQQVVSSLYQQGYELKSTFGDHAGYAATLIFVKSR